MCESHGTPYKELISEIPWPQDDPQIIPITEVEWNTLIAQWPNERVDEMVPILLKDQGILCRFWVFHIVGIQNFCATCFDNTMHIKKLSIMTFENEYVYVKVESADAPPEPKVESSKRGSRRGAQKNLHKFLVSSL